MGSNPTLSNMNTSREKQELVIKLRLEGVTYK
jgi:transposase